MRKHIGIIIIGFLVVVLGIFAVLFLSQNNVQYDSKAQGEQNKIDFQTYENQRYDFRVSYPEAIFTHIDRSQNDDGATLTNASGEITLSVYASHNVVPASIDDDITLVDVTEELRLDFSEVASVDQKMNSVVVRGIGKEGLERVEFGELSGSRGAIYFLELSYPEGALGTKVIDRIIDSFDKSVPQITFENSKEEETRSDEESDSGRYVETDLNYQMFRREDFSLLVPKSATHNLETIDRLKFTFLGSHNSPNSEISDGFTFTIAENHPLAEFYSEVHAYAEGSLNGDLEHNELISGLVRRSVNGYTTYRYVVESALGNAVTKYVFLPENGHGFVISYSIMTHPDGRTLKEYQDIIFTMLESLEFSVHPIVVEANLALLDYPTVGGLYTKESSGEHHGCDRVVMVPWNIENTYYPLIPTLQKLFSLEKTEAFGGWQNFLSQTNDTLSLDLKRTRVEDGTAHIYLKGSLSGLSGVCDKPRAKIQITQTALQFPWIENVELYLNGVPMG